MWCNVVVSSFAFIFHTLTETWRSAVRGAEGDHSKVAEVGTAGPKY